MVNVNTIDTPNKKISFNKILSLIVEKILPYLLMVIFAIRLFCYESKIVDFVGLESSPISKTQTIVSIVAIWLEYTAVILTILRTFFNINVLKNIIRFILIPIYLLNLVLLNPIVLLLEGISSSKMLITVYTIEIIVGMIIGVYYFVKDLKHKVSVKDILFMLGIFVLLMLASMPSYLPQFIFGFAKLNAQIKGFTFYHRLFMYISILFPVVLYFSIRNQSKEVIRFTLIYISIATMVVFLVNYNHTSFKEPWNWPFHLCNTAMFIIPICLIFKFKRLFYFTYFINVFGAIVAMLLPNYDANTNILSLRMFTFWYNHIIAYSMPLVIVALKEFKRPTIKEFVWSMIWFLFYFILVLILNVYFSALGHSVDYFFINSDFIADKLGKWAEDLFKLTTMIKIGEYNLEFHPFYQSAFFGTYVLLGFAMWFVYSEFFRIADSHYELHMRLKQIKLDEVAKKSVPTDRKREKFMEKISNCTAKLKLIGFSKKYATSKIYAVQNANLEVSEGEIFGFLGPNGAGKSTIIKSVVGIQPITEGNIEICGFDVATSPVEAKYNIGYVPDHYALYEKLTGREYINYIADIYDVPQKERDERIEKYVKIFQLEASIDSKIRTYSHGMKQKITIMSALVHNPKVWILDEPLTGLDPNSIYQVKECMKQHASEGNIVFFSSHLIDVVEKLCQKIAIIKKGKIQCVKTLEEIEATGTTLEQFYLDIIGDNEDN